MKKDKILTYSMIGFYCLWCMLEIYMIFSGTRLSGQSVSENTMQIRMGLYNVKNVLGYALAFAFALDCWYFGFYKTKSTKALFLKILKNMTVLFLLLQMEALSWNFLEKNLSKANRMLLLFLQVV